MGDGHMGHTGEINILKLQYLLIVFPRNAHLLKTLVSH